LKTPQVESVPVWSFDMAEDPFKQQFLPAFQTIRQSLQSKSWRNNQVSTLCNQ